MVIGDANDDDTLLAAGIDRAATLIAALSRDSDNLSLTLTAGSLRPDLFIVAGWLTSATSASSCGRAPTAW